MISIITQGNMANMAKLDWQKVKHSYQPEDFSNSNKWDTKIVSDRLTRQAELWPIKGKYQGTLIKHLPLHYLKWVGMNFNTSSKGFKLAVEELERRIKSTHKVGRPDR